MKKFFSLSLAIFLVAIAMAQPPKGPANSGTTFGKVTTAKGAVPISKVAGKIKENKETAVKLKGKVVEVCSKMGCWLKLESPAGNVRVELGDHEFFVPMALSGKEVVIDGTAKMKITSVKDQKHFIEDKYTKAEDADKLKSELAKITADKKEIVVTAKGLLVL